MKRSVLLWVLLLLASPFAAADEQVSPSVFTSVRIDDVQPLFDRLLIASPYRIPPHARVGIIRYTVQLPEAVAWQWPQTADQRVRTVDQGLEITVCEGCGPVPPPDPAGLQRFLQPNRWVDSEGWQVRRFARRNASGASVERRMQSLERAVRHHLTGAVEFDRYDSASTALRRRAGDCTETAILLAAAARARGIPARLVFGIAHSDSFAGREQVFVPHAWVEAWTGDKWRSFDAALEAQPAARIGLLIGDGSATGLGAVMQAIDALRIVDAVEVRRREAPGHPASASSSASGS